MRFDVDLHRHTIKLPHRLVGGKALEMSVVEAAPVNSDKYCAPTMVFLHGFGGRAAYWDNQLEQFHEEYRVIALDLRGHGYTDAPDAADGALYDVPELVADIEAALAVLQVPPRFTLVCHSFGGALASYFVNKHPQRVQALVIIASAVRFRLRLAGRMLLRVPPTILTWLREGLQFLGFNATKLYPPAHVVYLQNRNALATWDGSDYLRAIKVPTLVILGQRDILFSDAAYRAVAALIPGAEQVVIPVSAHQVMVERPDAVNRAMNDFLQGQLDPVALAESRALQRAERRAARKLLEAQRPWLKYYDPRTTYRIKPPNVALPRLMETTARRFGKTVALEYFGRKITWRELDKLANRFAHGLLARRVRAGERVMLALPNTPQWVIAYFGVLKIGAVAVLAEATLDRETLLNRIAHSRSVVLVTGSTRYQELHQALQDDARASGLRRVVFATIFEYMGWQEKLKFAALHHVQDGHLLPWFRSAPKQKRIERRFARFSDVLYLGGHFPPDIALNIDDVAVVAYTYGSTGSPLPVPLTHRNLASNALQLRHWLPEARPGDERFLAQQSFASAYGLTCLLHAAVYLGATMIVLPNNDVGQLLRAVQRLRPTYFPTTPRMVLELSTYPRVRDFGLASIRVCAVSGSALPREVREKFEKITRGRLIQAYGLTEASAAVIGMPIASRGRGNVIGLPLPDTEAKIIDLDTGEEAGIDVAGELWVSGPQVFAGYDVGQPPDPRIEKANVERLRDGWFATGDIASVDEDGFFTIIERKTNMVTRGGQRIFPRQIEEVLFEHPAVEMAQVKRESDEEGVVHLRAYVSLYEKSVVSEAELLKYCRKRLPAWALPDSMHIASQRLSERSALLGRAN